MKQKLEFHCSDSDIGCRLDKFLGQSEKLGSRSRAAKLIEQGLVFIIKGANPAITAKASDKLMYGDTVLVELPEAKPSELRPNNIPIDLLFEDEDILVLNKPAGLVVHPSAGHETDTLVNALIAHSKDLSMGFGEQRPGIVHRLDKDTSGVLVVAKNDKAHEFLAQQFKNKSAHRKYFALVYGRPKENSGKITSYLRRHPTDRKRFSSYRGADGRIVEKKPLGLDDSGFGKWAATNFKLEKPVAGELSYLSLVLETGRTHQIRVHLSEKQLPLVADQTYTPSSRLSKVKDAKTLEVLKKFPRMALHASELGFIHPKTKENLFFQVDWPKEMRGLLKELGAL